MPALLQKCPMGKGEKRIGESNFLRQKHYGCREVLSPKSKVGIVSGGVEEEAENEAGTRTRTTGERNETMDGMSK